MWRTPCGERVLKGAEAELLRAGLARIVAGLDREAERGAAPWQSGVELFDELTLEQRVGVLAEVARGLFDREFAAPALTAVNEAALGAVFAMLESCVTHELDEEPNGAGLLEDPALWRKRIQSCLAEVTEVRGCPIACTDRSRWVERLTYVAENILWDEDFQAAELFLDADPCAARLRKLQWGVGEDYYSTAAPEPLGQALADAWDCLYALGE